MSVLMTLRFPADRSAIERASQEQHDVLIGIAERSKGYGAIHHSFYAGDGEVIVVDEWESPEGFQAFFDAERENIGKVMAAAGIDGPSGQPTFYEKLDLGDEF